MYEIKILIVEDELLIAHSLARKLKKLGYAVIDIVSSGTAALQVMTERDVDLVLMDIVIKGEADGIETADKIYKIFGVPVIYLTAYADDQTLRRAEKTGCYGYLLKPFNEKEINANIRMAVRKHQQETQIIKSLEIAESFSRKLQKTLTQTIHRISNADQIALQTDIFFALENGELQIYYQPLVNLISDKIVGAEALLRWHHPQRGLILPDSFIPLAEETGMIDVIGEWVFQQACAQVQDWQLTFATPLSLGVNLSRHQLKQSNLSHQISHALGKANLTPANLELELSERILKHDTDFVIRTINEVKEIGIHLSIDDFGTGASSLGYLQRFPVDTLKFDRAFIGDVHQNPDKVAITRAIIQMALGLNLKVVAEGVETAAEIEFLRQSQCEVAQGYFFSPALPSTEFEQLLYEQEQTPCRVAE